MKNTPTPWAKSVLFKTSIADGKVYIGQFQKEEDTDFAIEACNNYETLKAENAKLQESNNQMAELLKETIEFINCLDTWEVLKYSKEKDLSNKLFDNIERVLTAAGHKL